MSERESWVIDLDGVLWLMDDPIAGSVEAVGRLLEAGVEVTFATNNGLLTKAEYSAKLERIGVDSTRVKLLSSAGAAASLLEPGERAYVVGGAGVIEALVERGVEVVDSSDVDVVVAGWDRDISYPKLARACRALRTKGARLVATNSDPIYPTPQGPLPGAGSIIAAVVAAGGVTPTWAGKPEAPMAAAVRALVGEPTLMVGDRLETDGAFAEQLGCDFALVMSGVTKDTPSDEDRVAHVSDDLASLVEKLIG